MANNFAVVVVVVVVVVLVSVVGLVFSRFIVLCVAKFVAFRLFSICPIYLRLN